MKKVKDIVSKMTLKEKVRLLSGKDFWLLEGYEHLGLPSIMVTDGPHGLRKQAGSSDHAGLNKSVKSTCFPTAVTLASTWNKDLIYKLGEALGDECRTEEVSVLLGPGANIKRHPLCGRNFEYFSEDPLLSGKLASSFIQGVQSKGIGTSLKHYVANNQEAMRMAVDTFVDERTLREMYLKSFEIAVKDAQPWTVMCSYNKVNGTYLSEHKRLLSDVLKDEWQHEGIVVTDWGACNNRVDGLIAGQELEMPGGLAYNDKLLIKAIQEGRLQEDLLNKRVEKLVELILKSKETLDQEFVPYDKEKHHDFSAEIAKEGIVLLQNKNNVLPLNKKQSVCLIGEFAEKPRYQGNGSSLIQPTKITTVLETFTETLGDKLSYAKGYRVATDQVEDPLIHEAVELAKGKDVVFVMLGLTPSYESEGFDRTHLRLPTNHLYLIEELSKVHDNIIVSLSNGAPVLIPFKDKVNGIIEQYLGGQNSGTALRDIVFGFDNPSGKLAETFPNNLEEFPSNQNFPGRPRQVEYREGLYVGYRFYDSVDLEPLYPFGYGLSYTTFEYSDLEVNVGKDINITYKITNTGQRDGKEISQVYIGKHDSAIYRPMKELKAFDKTLIKTGETKEIKLTIPLSELSVYYSEDFEIENGEYNVYVGSSSKDIHLSESIHVDGSTFEKESNVYHNIDKDFYPTKTDFEDLAKFMIPEYPGSKPYTLNSTIGEAQATLVGRVMKKALYKQFSDHLVDESEDADSLQNMIDHMVDDLPFRSLVMLSGGKLSKGRALGLIDLMNKRVLRGLFRLIKG